jgi:alpha-ketoglutarate-dependent taurine dioxygenase
MMRHRSPNLPLPGALPRARLVALEPELVRTASLGGDPPFPLLVEPASFDVDLAAWAEENRPWIDARLDQHGALLFRGFAVHTPEVFERFMIAASGKLLPYKERSSPRREVHGHVYSSTEHPPDQAIFFHNENSYQSTFPGRLGFCCVRPAERGGETPIAHAARVLSRIPLDIQARFLERQWMCVRNYREGLGLSWQDVFQTRDRAEVEAHCAREGISFEWQPGGRLTTRAVRPAIARHPRTKQRSWFNHAAFFHVSTLDPKVRDALALQLPPEELPANTYYGDGQPIEPDVLETIRQAYAAEAASFTWQRGDVLLVDNILVAHGRAAFEGERIVVVAMAALLTRAEVQEPHGGVE